MSGGDDKTQEAADAKFHAALNKRIAKFNYDDSKSSTARAAISATTLSEFFSIDHKEHDALYRINQLLQTPFITLLTHEDLERLLSCAWIRRESGRTGVCLWHSNDPKEWDYATVWIPHS